MNIPFNKISDITTGASRKMDSERRQSMRMIYYWDHLRGNRAMPMEDDIDKEHEAIADIWDHCFMVQVSDIKNKEFNYIYLGSAIVDAYQGPLRDFDHKKMASLKASKLIDTYHEVMISKRPVIYTGEHDNGAGSILKFRQSLLPLGGNDVEIILGHVTFHVFGAQK